MNVSPRGCLLPTGECWCGCGQETRIGSFFLAGHDKTAESAVIAVEYGGVPQFLHRHGYGPGGRSARQAVADLHDKEGRRIEYYRRSPMTLFDTYVIMDWSAKSRRGPLKQSPDQIWWTSVRSGDPQTPHYVRTRREAIEGLTDFIVGELDGGRRVLVGFDFPLGYPGGTARTLTDQDSALRLWEWVSDRIIDKDDNSNNRFKVAEEINSLFRDSGPCWGWRPRNDAPGIPMTRKDRSWSMDHPCEFRIAEKCSESAKSVWQLIGRGSVGSQTLVGLPALKRLITDSRIKGRGRVWPFETGLQVPESDAKLVIVEVYPSIIRDEIEKHAYEDEIKDSAQVRVLAKAFANLDSKGELGPLFEGSQSLTPTERSLIENEEGWILGLGHVQALRETLRR